jgi:hypothetical protein
MKKERLELIWNDSVVGYIEDWNVDMWFWYGKWIPLDTPTTAAFLETIHTHAEAKVILDGRKGLVHSLPENGKIDVKIWSGMEW